MASKDLPGDFALIPDNDPAAFVKASVPGTEDAKDAVLLASIPRTVAMEANTPPKLEVRYDGQPNFQVIPSTTVQYATNTARSVFLVNGGYYCCDGGVWYSSSSPTGPWVYCTRITSYNVCYTKLLRGTDVRMSAFSGGQEKPYFGEKNRFSPEDTAYDRNNFV